MVENKKVITWSLIILFLMLAIIYSLTYMKKATLFKTWFTTIENSINTENDAINLWSTTDTQNNLPSANTNVIDLGQISTSWVTNSHTQAPRSTESSTSARLASTNSKMLSGTSEYLWVLDIVEILWTTPLLTLQDSKWNYFVYYGDNLDFVQTVEKLGGNVYTMTTEAEIIQNQLFWDKVSYINLSSFKDSQVIMVIEIEWDIWLLQIPSNKYHYNKSYLKSLFIQ